MPNYELGKVYTIKCNQTGEIYVGSTAQKKMCNRMAGHIQNLNDKKTKRSCTSFTILERNDYKVEVIEEYSCNNKEELEEREKYYIRKLRDEGKVLVNANVPRQTRAEYEATPKAKAMIKEDNKRYNAKHKDEIKEKRQEYFDEYNSKEETKERKHDWYEANKAALAAKASERIICECGIEIARGKIARHSKTQKHLKLMEKKCITCNDEEITMV